MIVISDTTPILLLLKAGCLGLLEKLYGNVLIPKAVYRELTENPSYLEEADIVKATKFFSVAFSKFRAIYFSKKFIVVMSIHFLLLYRFYQRMVCLTEFPQEQVMNLSKLSNTLQYKNKHLFLFILPYVEISRNHTPIAADILHKQLPTIT